MIFFLLNVLLALAWAALVGDFTPMNLLAGFIFGYAALWIMQFVMQSSNYFGKFLQIALFVPYFLWELVKANVRMAYHVLMPLNKLRPGVIGIPLDITTDAQITMLANMITLTPGTLSLDVSTDRRVLYVHNFVVDDPEAFRQEIKNGFERKVLEVTR
ncbi:MAG: Na(+)/H(+) antiporter subunit E [Anaerolineae bacterium]|nr:Na(+)/H(+) antiporter subunit E [Anaerolineae bacterium]